MFAGLCLENSGGLGCWAMDSFVIQLARLGLVTTLLGMVSRRRGAINEFSRLRSELHHATNSEFSQVKILTGKKLEISKILSCLSHIIREVKYLLLCLRAHFMNYLFLISNILNIVL